MALNATGPISLGGCTVGQSIAKELSLSGTAQISMNCTAVRKLAGVCTPGSLIAVGTFYGKSSATVPGAPTIGSATTSTSTTATVTFSAPGSNGGATITGYQVVCTNTGSNSATGSSSPITVSGLSSGTTYSFKVRAQNSVGYGSYSGSSNSVTPGYGSALFTSPGSYCWTVPTGVTSISIVGIGGGNGGTNYAGEAGGALAYKNNFSVTPGQVYRVVVGAKGTPVNEPHGGGHSYGGHSIFGTYCNTCQFFTAQILVATGGGFACNPVGTAGYKSARYGTSGGGGGAGGYSGNGGTGGGGGSGGCPTYGIPANWTPTIGQAGTGGSGGGGAGSNCISNQGSGGGGGVGLFGQGTSGAATGQVVGSRAVTPGGNGGSGGSNGVSGGYRNSYANGGDYGGGGGGQWNYTLCTIGGGGYGGSGGLRIVWPGSSRQYPSTNVGTP